MRRQEGFRSYRDNAKDGRWTPPGCPALNVLNVLSVLLDWLNVGTEMHQEWVRLNLIVWRWYKADPHCLSGINYVNRDDNPAEDGSKGLKLDAMLKNNRLLKGPRFLWEAKSHWPIMIEIPTLRDGDLEARKEALVYAAAVHNDVLESWASSYPSWWKLKIAVAWLLRYKKYLQMKVWKLSWERRVP